ncbi:MAG: hypothetical protein ACRDBQ_15250, partial [Shewanella sp.]
MVMGANPNGRVDGVLRGALDSGVLALATLPPPLRSHLLPLFSAWQQHGLAEMAGDQLLLTLAGRFWNVNLQAGLFEFLQHNPLDGSGPTPAQGLDRGKHPGGLRHTLV